MNSYLRTRQRMLVRAFDAYMAADRKLKLAEGDAARFFPGGTPKSVWMIGTPGSRIRRLYETRDRALDRVLTARVKLHMAQRRMRVLSL